MLIFILVVWSCKICVNWRLQYINSQNSKGHYSNSSQLFNDKCGIIFYISHGYCEIHSVIIRFCKWITVHQANVSYACMHGESSHNTYSFIWLPLYCILSHLYKQQFILYMAEILWLLLFLFNCKSSHELLGCHSAIWCTSMLPWKFPTIDHFPPETWKFSPSKVLRIW